MAIFVSLVNFTDQGIRYVKNTIQRADAFRETANKLGVEVKEIYWTLGSYDLVIIVEAPDDESVATMFMSVGSLGNIRFHTLRGFSAKEMERMVKNIP